MSATGPRTRVALDRGLRCRRCGCTTLPDDLICGYCEAVRESCVVREGSPQYGPRYVVVALRSPRQPTDDCGEWYTAQEAFAAASRASRRGATEVEIIIDRCPLDIYAAPSHEHMGA